MDHPVEGRATLLSAAGCHKTSSGHVESDPDARKDPKSLVLEPNRVLILPRHRLNKPRGDRLLSSVFYAGC
jgi:hypothetical protein